MPATTPTAQDLAAMAFLSWAAYDSNGDTAWDRLTGSGWEVVGPLNLGMSESQFEGGFYEVGGAAALVAYRNGVIAIALRGSEAWADPGDWGSAAFTQEAHFNDLRPLILAVLAYIEGLPAGTIDQIYITGHSLGGAMAELAALDYGARALLTGADVSVATFGSPGTQRTSGDNALTNTIVHVGHQDDEVFNHTLFATGDFVRRGSAAVTIVIPDESSVGWNNWTEHLPELYERSLAFLAQSVFAQDFLSNAANRTIIVDAHDTELFDPTSPLYASSYSTAEGTIVVAVYGNDQIFGTSRSDWIDAGGGVDIVAGYDGDDRLYGGDGDDELRPGAGDDFVDGGDHGAIGDTVVFVQPRSAYNISSQGGTLVFTPLPGALQLGMTTVVNVEHFVFGDGAEFSLSQLQPPLDGTPPQLSFATPADNEGGVIRTSSIVLTFNEPVFAGSGAIRIYRSDGVLHQSIAVVDTSRVLFSGNVVVVDPSADFQPGTGYYVLVDSGAILDQAGNSFAGLTTSTALNFTTAAGADSAAPIFTGASPADNANGVAVGANIVLTFNEHIVAGAGNILIHDSSGVVRTISVNDGSQVSISGNTVTLNPSIDLAFGTDYYVTVDAGAVRDLANNPFTGLTSPAALNFTTQSAAQLPPPQQQDIFLTILDNSIRENANGGMLSIAVVVTGAGAGSQPVSVQFATQDIPGAGSGATASQDYIATSGILLIPAGETVGYINITLMGDAALEGDEVFRIVLSQPSADVTLANTFATGSILNDDSAPNRLPQTSNDFVITAAGTPILVDVLANDIDADGDVLSVAQVFNGSPGATYVIQPDNTILVTPAPGTEGVLQFGYVADDGHGQGINGFVNVIVSGDGSPTVINSGTASDDIIFGAGGNDLLSGGFGDDVIYGAGGSDRIDGGAGFDYLDLRGANHGAHIQLADPWVFDDGDGGHDVVTNIEGVLGTPFDDLIDAAFGQMEQIATGYRFYGNDGDDRLTSDAGDDVLDGGAGNDELIFGAGSDTVFGGAGNDRIFSNTADAIGDSLYGGAGNDDVFAHSGNSPDVVEGGAGNDIITLGGGDEVSGGAGADTFNFYGFNAANPPHARVTDLAIGESIGWTFPLVLPNGPPFWFAGPITSGDGAGTAHGHIEHQTSGGLTTLYFGYDSTPGADFVLELVGEFSIDQLDVDTANGGSLLIHVQGGAADDVIQGGSRIPSSYSGPGRTYDGNAGIDTIDYSSLVQGITVDLSVAEATGAEIGADLILEIENVVGGAGADDIRGSSGTNVLSGGAGNDTLNGGVGVDAMYGGDGDDTYVVDNAGDATTEVSAAGGTDTVQSSVTRVLGANLENLVLTGAAAISGYGNALDNTITGNSAANVLNGGDGNDVLDGGGGADAMTGNLGDDSYYVDAAGDTVSEGNISGGVDQVFASVSFSLAATGYADHLTLMGVSAINGAGNSLNNTIAGNSAANVLQGSLGDDTLNAGAGNDTLYGGDGLDTLDGGAGADTMIGNLGNDAYYVDDAGDVVLEGNIAGGTDQVFASVSFNLGPTGYADHLTLTGSSNIDGFGNILGNTLTGNSGINALWGNGGNDTLVAGDGADSLYGGDGADSLDGGTGADTMIGNFGNDTYHVDNAGDVVSEGNSAGGTDTVFASVSFHLGPTGFADHLTLTGGAAINATGNSLANTLTGNSAANTLIGNAGNDTLNGAGGNDLLQGGDGADALDGGAGADAMIGNAGNDSYYVDDAGDTVSEGSNVGGTDSVFASVSFNLAPTGFVENLTLTGSDAVNATGNNLANTLTGNAAANTLTGAGGTDSFVFASALGGGNVDAIADFSVVDDTIILNNAIFTGLSAGALDAGAFVIGSAAADADDRIIYDSASGQLFFDADGVGGADQVLFATLTAGLALTNADFIVSGP